MLLWVDVEDGAGRAVLFTHVALEDLLNSFHYALCYNLIIQIIK